MWADAVHRDGRLDLLDIVTKCGREDSLWLLEVGRSSRYKILVQDRAPLPQQGRGEGSQPPSRASLWRKTSNVYCVLACFCSLGPETPPLRSGAFFFPGLGSYSPDGPAGLRASGSNFAPAPRPAAQQTAGVGGPPGPKSALGRSPSCHRPPSGCWAWRLWLWLGALEQPVTGLYGPGVE